MTLTGYESGVIINFVLSCCCSLFSSYSCGWVMQLSSGPKESICCLICIILFESFLLVSILFLGGALHHLMDFCLQRWIKPVGKYRFALSNPSLANLASDPSLITMKGQSYSLQSQKAYADIFCIGQVTLQKQVDVCFLKGIMSFPWSWAIPTLAMERINLLVPEAIQGKNLPNSNVYAFGNIS